MSWIDKSLMAEPTLLALLQPDERLLAGEERVIGAAAAVVAAVVAPTGWSGGDLPARMLGGTAVLGTPSSAGVSMLRALRDGPASRTFAVTDRRILLMSSETRKDGAVASNCISATARWWP